MVTIKISFLRSSTRSKANLKSCHTFPGPLPDLIVELNLADVGLTSFPYI